MRRTSLLFAIIALAAGLFLSGAALAHGGKQHAHSAHHAAAAETTGPSGLIVVAMYAAGDAAGVEAHMHRSGDSECPADATDCCSTHCCAPAGLRVEPGNAPPTDVFAPKPMASEGPPPDAAREALFRPPCR